jgi:hypothetical protein
MQIAADFFAQGLFYRSTNGAGATAWSRLAIYGNNYANTLYATVYYYSSDTSVYLAYNGGAHTPWRIGGNKGGYGGIYDDYSAVNGIMYDSSGNGGVYRAAYGWYFYFSPAAGCMGVNGSTTSSSYGLYVTKGIYSTGDIVAYSDARKKKNIVTIDGALDLISRIRGVYYNRIDVEELNVNPNKRQIGVIAQEVNEVLPEVVTYAADVDDIITLATRNIHQIGIRIAEAVITHATGHLEFIKRTGNHHQVIAVIACDIQGCAVAIRVDPIITGTTRQLCATAIQGGKHLIVALIARRVDIHATDF